MIFSLYSWHLILCPPKSWTSSGYFRFGILTYANYYHITDCISLTLVLNLPHRIIFSLRVGLISNFFSSTPWWCFRIWTFQVLFKVGWPISSEEVNSKIIWQWPNLSFPNRIFNFIKKRSKRTLCVIVKSLWHSTNLCKKL